MKNLLRLGVALNKAEQQSIKGGGESLLITSGGFCCEWCPDGSCNGWVDNPRTPCPFANTCN